MTVDPVQRAVALARQGKMAEARDAFVEAADTTTASRATLLARASELSLYLEGVEAAAALAQRARDAAASNSDPHEQSAAACAMARVHLRRHTDTAIEDALAILDGLGDRVTSDALACKLRAIAEARRGRVRVALELFDSAYELADGDVELRARVLLAAAVQLRNWGLFAEARRRVERSLEIRLQIEDLYGAALCYGVLAFIHQRQGDHLLERDALAADLRMCERLGGAADAPALHGRLAGALVALGKYAGAQIEAERAIELEAQRLGNDTETRVHGYAWREQARVAMAQSRYQAAAELSARGRKLFDSLGDGYGAALCRLTEAEVVSNRLGVAAADAGDDVRSDAHGLEARGSSESSEALEGFGRACLAAARPVFVRLGAVPEAVESVLLECALDARCRADHRAAVATSAGRICRQVLPMLQRAGLGSSPLYQRALRALEQLDPAVARDRLATRAAMLRSLAGVIVEDEPQPASVVAARLPDETSALAFARAAVDDGAVVWWPTSTIGAAVFFGEAHERRALDVGSSHGASRAAIRSGSVDLEHLWPADTRARGAAVDRALSAAAAADARDERTS